MANAESYITRNVDYVIEFQTDAAFGEMIMNKMNMNGIGVTAIDIPMPGAGFFGANNPKSGYIGGLHLASAAITKWGPDVGKDACFNWCFTSIRSCCSYAIWWTGSRCKSNLTRNF